MTMKNIGQNKALLFKLAVAFIVVGVEFQNCGKISIQDVPAVASTIDSLATPISAPRNPTAALVPPSTALNVHFEPVPGFVCSPFGVSTAVGEKSGLKTELRYI